MPVQRLRDNVRRVHGRFFPRVRNNGPRASRSGAAVAPDAAAANSAQKIQNTDETIRKILTETRTIAMVGASPNPERMSNQVMDFLIQRGYRVIPVNPTAVGTEILGQEVVGSLKDIQEQVDMVDVFRRSEEVPQIVDDAIAIGAKSVWLQVGIINDEAGQRAIDAGLDFVQNICPRVETKRLGLGLVNNDATIIKILTETQTIAMVGASNNPERMSNKVMAFLIQRGYHVIPVNPMAVGTQILGMDVVGSLKDIQVPVDMVDVFRRSEEANQIVEDAIAIGARSVWLQVGVINDEAGQRAREAGLDFVQNICPRVETLRLGLNLVNNDFTIREILENSKCIAMVGASPNPERMSHQVMAFLLKQGYEVIPVNPVAVGQQILGQDVVASLKDIQVPVDMVDVFRRSEEVPQIVQDAIEIGATSVWLQVGIINNEAGLTAREAGLMFVQNTCPRVQISRLGLGLVNNDATIIKILTETQTIAMVGASNNPERMSNKVMAFLIQRGYHVIPVNPTAVGQQILGMDVVGSLKDIQEPVDMVDVFRRSEEANQIVEDAIAIGARSVWLQVGIINDEAGQRAREAGLDFVSNICPRVETLRLGLGLVNNDYTIRQILTETQTIAMVGASPNPDRMSNQVMEFLLQRGYNVIPVNPVAVGQQILGQDVVGTLKDIQEQVDMVDVFRRSEEVPQIVEDAIEIGARSVWLQVGIMNDEAGIRARDAGLMFVQNICPRVETGRLGLPLVNNDNTMWQVLTETQTIAVVGASNNPERASNQVMDFMMQRGYRAIPVNPTAAGTQILGMNVVASLQEIDEPVDMVQVFRRSEEAPQIVEDAIEIGALSVWLQPGIVNDDAGLRARSAGLNFVQDVCPRVQIPRLGVPLVNNDFTIHKILTETQTIAMVGASPSTDRPSNIIMNFLLQEGFRVIPVNPTVPEGTTILGEVVVPYLVDIQEEVDMVHVFRRAEEVPQIVEDAISINARSVWLQTGILNEDAGLRAREAGLDFVQDLCPRDELQRMGQQLENDEDVIRRVLTDTQTIALVGASSRPEKPAHFVMDFLMQQGYRVVPVNPNAVGTQIMGMDVVGSLLDIQEEVDMVHVFRNANEADQIVEDAIQIGARSVWLQVGVINNGAGWRAKEEGMDFVQNTCPFRDCWL